jgi:integrase
VALVTFEALDKIVAKAREKKSDRTGGNFAAQKLRKELKRLFGYAVKLGWLPSNPVAHVNPIKIKSDGFHSWTEDEIRKFRDYWAYGTRQRLAMEIMLWTAKRISDVAKLGPQHIDACWLNTRDGKTGKWNTIPVSRELQQAIDKMAERHLCFIVTSFGKPYSEKSLSQTFSKWCSEAGLPHCSAHGLRKAMARRMAENGATNSEMKAITQHSGDAELSVYTRGVNQQTLAQKVMTELENCYSGMKIV